MTDFEKLGVFYLCREFNPPAIAIRPVRLSPRKSDIVVGRVTLLWAPWQTSADGLPRPAFALRS